MLFEKIFPEINLTNKKKMNLISKSKGIARKSLSVNSDNSISEPMLRGVVSQAYRKLRYTSSDNSATALDASDFAFFINFVSGFTVTALDMPSALDLAQMYQGVVDSIELDDGSSDNFTSIEANIRNDTSNDITLSSLDINTLYFVDPDTGANSATQVISSNSTLVFNVSFPQLGVTPIVRILLVNNTKSDGNLVGNLTPLNDIPGGGIPATLNYYEIFTFSTTWSGIWAAPIVANTVFIRLGRLCIMQVPDVLGTSLLASQFSNTTTPFPTRFRPSVTFYLDIRTVIAGVAGTSLATFANTGILTVTDTFLIGNSGMRSSMISYQVVAP